MKRGKDVAVPAAAIGVAALTFASSGEAAKAKGV